MFFHFLKIIFLLNNPGKRENLIISGVPWAFCLVEPSLSFFVMATSRWPSRGLASLGGASVEPRFARWSLASLGGAAESLFWKFARLEASENGTPSGELTHRSVTHILTDSSEFRVLWTSGVVHLRMICGYLPELHNGLSSSSCHFLSSIGRGGARKVQEVQQNGGLVQDFGQN